MLLLATGCVARGRAATRAPPEHAGNRERWKSFVHSKTADAVEARLRRTLEVYYDAFLDLSLIHI